MKKRFVMLMTFLSLIASQVCFASITIDRIGIVGQNKNVQFGEGKKAKFDDRICIVVSGSDDGLKPPYNNAVIYINHERISSYKVLSCDSCGYSDSSKCPSHLLSFILTKDVNAWTKWICFCSADTTLSVGIGNDLKELSCQNHDIEFHYDKQMALWIPILFSLVIVILTVVLVFHSSIIRVVSKLPAKFKPFSLSRFQLLWWTIIIIISYVFLYALRGEFVVLNTSVLILLGISASGTGFARTIDYSLNKDKPGEDKTEGFFTDLLSDGDGINVHRYQNLLFTIVFGFIFIYKTIQSCSMPDFGTLELTLIGLSTATYVGLKTTEKKTKETTDTTAKDDEHIKDESVNAGISATLG